ncbi:FUSC family protein [Cytobacillus depressus]|uniref:FUSC family protein n=1 Tax=Cytobacillus depressus TaxID=1602942 RepID=A0A6L3V1C6_9BACI|nr:FUSC family protein [Cytobacillus depressus]KAB2332079.1 FUSC family protein [Cytobacillus depressus]
MQKNMIKGAFTIRKNPYPWTRAISAGICTSLPVMIGILFENFQSGLLAGLGGFSYLYVFNEPYPQRAKKVFFILLGLAASIGLGTLTASSPLLFAIMLGLIGAVGTYIFGALKMPGPASIFFLIVFAMTSMMPGDLEDAAFRAGLVLLGGSISWIVAMIGWFFDPHGPEMKAVKNVYLQLATLLQSVRTDGFNDAKEKTLSALKDADDILVEGSISWQSSNLFKRLYLLKEKAHLIWSDILELSAEERTKLPPELGDSLQALADSLDRKSSPLKILQVKEKDSSLEQIISKIYEAAAVLNEPISQIDEEIKLIKPTFKRILSDAFDKHSIVFLSSIKYGIVLMIAALIAFIFEFERSYWIPISCGAVMLGSTVLSTFQRAIQRSIGTIVGILLAAVILSIKPEAITVAFFIALLQFLTELFIVRNYAFAVTFITPNVLLMAESTSHVHNLPHMATARVVDIIIGSCIGLIGALLIGRKSASSRLPHLMAKTIRSQSQLFHRLFSAHTDEIMNEKNIPQSKMRTNLANLKTVYFTALGEILNNVNELEYFSPAIFSMEHLGYLLEASLKDTERPNLSDESLAQFLIVFESMALTVEFNLEVERKSVPLIEGYSKIRNEIISMGTVLASPK